ncbi:alanine racemase [Angomonas deanei]|uniref:Pyridoxal phosphate homeostasis protein n=1 Tax=Angomonas deanei TaxID=59799 RepID=S9WPJ4_9TRYP|nr:alanine racemase [Angomonas deanei]EPY41161.1 alanine racemase [Angomonas deanei]CAD2220819.1 Alanine racemase, N-terminal domain containing protein, putative [Angomonas deanei]|eukprot:EPY35127.1 alanine racemase [Angomonas deanei]
MSRYDIASEPTAEHIKENYEEVLANIKEASEGRPVQLVAVSKTKSPACLKALYDLGHRVFGENYVQELCEKAPELPADMEWRFIGHLQSNKVKELLSTVPNLSCIETVDSAKLSDKINDGCERYREGRPIQVLIQVNTSGEESKSGIEPAAVTELATHIHTKCDKLILQGLMTIGMPDYSSKPENFECLVKCREEVAKALALEPDTLQLSMGMSGDYVNAIKMGSTSVRVGSSLFGQRFYPPKK